MLQSLSMRNIGFAVSVMLAVTAAPSAQSSTSSSSFTVPVVYQKLPNGLRVVVSENHAAPVVVVELMYRIGFRIEPRNRTGFAHLFEHLMFQGSEHVAKFEHVRIVNENGGVLNGSTRFDHTNYFEVMPSNALELAMWLEADRMRSLKITPETLKNQQDVVSEEVRVNVLNQPYAAFEWLGLPQKANTNWYNAHNFYGDVSGGFNYGLGNNFDYSGPMLYTFRVDYRPDLKGADVLKVVDKVINSIQEHGITEDELKQAKVNFRSSFLENLESGSGFGRADLLAALALYDDDPNRINTILSDLDKVTTADV